MVLIVLGAPGAGKGSQTRELAKHYGITQISTGDILRDLVSKATAIGQEIAESMSAGALVHDDLIVSIVRDRVKEGDCKDGFILDGFPRTLAQARAVPSILDEVGEELVRVISIDVPDSVILERMSGRLVCPMCAAMFHINYYPPKKPGVCDNCGAELVIREDDKANTVLYRLKTYHELTEPIIDYYTERGLLSRVSGVGEKSDITSKIIATLGGADCCQYS